MRRLAVLVGIAAVLAAAVVAVAARHGAAASARRTASVSLVRFVPMTVQGRGFAPRERVTVEVVTATAGGRRWATHVRATAAGQFTASLPGARVSRCSGFVVRALGANGTRATAKRMQRPACMPVGVPAGAPASAA